MSSIDTINVIEMADDEIIGMKSYLLPDGEKEANKRFKALAMEKGAEEDEMGDFFADGYYESGNYQLFLVKSK